MKLSKTLAIALESVGICVVAVGIGIEVLNKADIGFVIITCGSVIVAIGGMMFAKLLRR